MLALGIPHHDAECKEDSTKRSTGENDATANERASAAEKMIAKNWVNRSHERPC